MLSWWYFNNSHVVGVECYDAENENDDDIHHLVLLILLFVCNSTKCSLATIIYSIARYRHHDIFYLSFLSDRFTQTSPMISRSKSAFGLSENVDWISFKSSPTWRASSLVFWLLLVEVFVELEKLDWNLYTYTDSWKSVFTLSLSFATPSLHSASSLFTVLRPSNRCLYLLCTARERRKGKLVT